MKKNEKISFFKIKPYQLRKEVMEYIEKKRRIKMAYINKQLMKERNKIKLNIGDYYFKKEDQKKIMNFKESIDILYNELNQSKKDKKYMQKFIKYIKYLAK